MYEKQYEILDLAIEYLKENKGFDRLTSICQKYPEQLSTTKASILGAMEYYNKSRAKKILELIDELTADS